MVDQARSFTRIEGVDGKRGQRKNPIAGAPSQWRCQMKKFIVLLILCCSSSQVWPEEATLQNIKVDTDLPAIERGMDDLMNNCHACHTLKYISYLDLLKLGIDKKKVDF